MSPRLAGTVLPMAHTRTHTDAASRVADAISLLALDTAYMATCTRDALGGHGNPEQLLRSFVAEYGAICAWCGVETAPSLLQLAHLVPAAWSTPTARGGRRGGYCAPNLGASCLPCNIGQGDDMADPFTMARPDLVPLSWPFPISAVTPSGYSISWRRPIY